MLIKKVGASEKFLNRLKSSEKASEAFTIWWKRRMQIVSKIVNKIREIRSRFSVVWATTKELCEGNIMTRPSIPMCNVAART